MSETESRIAGLPCWDGKPEIEPLVGGLSNLSYVVRDGRGKYVARAGTDFPFHHVFRAREILAAKAAHAAGFAPEVVYDEEGLMVSRFIEGKVFAKADVRANIDPIAHLLRRFHDEMAAFSTGPAYLFWVFHVVREYARTLKAAANPLTDRLAEFLTANAQLEAAQTPLPIKFGHNDLLPANLIGDGKRLWLIDFEYAGFGTAMFDLAGLASNAGFNGSQSEALLSAYFDAPPDEEIRRSHAAMQCASLLREGLWSLVSEMFLSAPGVDYNAYAIENLDRFDAALALYRDRYRKD